MANDSDKIAKDNSTEGRWSAHDFLKYFYPQHTLHTITTMIPTKESAFVFKCDCGDTLKVTYLQVTEAKANVRWAKDCLRNVPMLDNLDYNPDVGKW